MAFSIDLNCDLGEYDDLDHGQNDAQIMSFISSCNIACGAHAGNQRVIDHTVTLAINNRVNIGAHPSYPDRTYFGRKMMHFPAKELSSMLLDQITAIHLSAHAQGASLMHVKPHGALYNQAACDFKLAMLLAEVIAEFITKYGQNLMLYGLAHSAMEQAAKEVGVAFVAEGFVDRAYLASRTLLPRSETGAVISDSNVMLKRVLALLKTGKISTISGEDIELVIQTLCLHGDHEGAIETAQALYHGLLLAGFTIQSPKL